MTKRRPGRPLETGRSYGVGRQILVRVSNEEYARLRAQSERDGCESVAEWMREVALANCK